MWQCKSSPQINISSCCLACHGLQSFITHNLFLKPHALVPLTSASLALAASCLSPSRAPALPKVTERDPGCHWMLLASCAPVPAGSMHVLCSSQSCTGGQCFQQKGTVGEKIKGKRRNRGENTPQMEFYRISHIFLSAEIFYTPVSNTAVLQHCNSTGH